MAKLPVENALRDAESLRQQGRIAEAIALLEPLARAHGDVPGVWHALGVAMASAKRFDDAAAALGHAAEVEPHSPEALNNLGAVLLMLRRAREAVAPLERALALRPGYGDAIRNLASAWFRIGDDAARAAGGVNAAAGDLAAAEEALMRAIDLRPDHAAALARLGNVRRQRGDVDAAVEWLSRAAAIEPRGADTLSNLGEALIAAGRAQEALEPLARAVALDPRHPQARLNLGAAMLRLGRSDEAVTHFEQAVRLDPQWPRAHMNLGAALLQHGEFARGWEEFEWRLRLPAWQAHEVTQRLAPWRGEPLEGRSIFLHAEQGFGDAIQFARYLPMVAERAGGAVDAGGAGSASGKIYIGCRAALRRLFERLPGHAGVIETGQSLPPVDYQCPLMSLPRVFGTTLQTIPAQVPYLDPPPDLVEAWRQRLGPRRRFRVGVAWSGNPANPNDRYRSIPLHALEPLLAMDDIEFHALQPHGVDHHPRLVSHAGAITDWAETAALLLQLDLVITVDTGVAHLAGALARPTWTLLSSAGEWRWMEHRDDSPWYPTMRLMRQHRAGDWDELVQRVAGELRTARATP